MLRRAASRSGDFLDACIHNTIVKTYEIHDEFIGALAFNAPIVEVVGREVELFAINEASVTRSQLTIPDWRNVTQLAGP